jgi:hypothetical protein
MLIFARRFPTAMLMIAMVMIPGSRSWADLVQWTMNKDEWISMVGEFTTIDFTGFTHGEHISDQYAHLGVTFSSAGSVQFLESDIFVNDGWGMYGQGGGGVWLDFDTPMNWIAADHPGVLWIALYYNDELIIEIGAFGGGGTGFFAGLISEKPFNKAKLFREPPFANLVGVDDLHFGALAVPAPGAIAMFGLAFAFNRRPRQRLASRRHA